jgi:hypothetical protein
VGAASKTQQGSKAQAAVRFPHPTSSGAAGPSSLAIFFRGAVLTFCGSARFRREATAGRSRTAGGRCKTAAMTPSA